ncbi:MBL fold metallo-hydrolase [Leptospira sp. 201903071]|nr:MBL fold metallo-hydrolase [Leptospira ainazelensis]
MSLTASNEREKTSPHWRDGQFVNPQPLVNHISESLLTLFRKSEFSSPFENLNIDKPDPDLYQIEPASGLRVTWFGHSSTLVEIDGYKILTDPIWSDRPSPLTWAGPKRWYAPPLAFENLPKIDAVVISHDHYDHLDYKTILALNEKGTTFIVPLGVGQHLLRWGIEDSKIIELDWWESVQIRDLRIVATPARHASGRILFDKDKHLWAGYALIGAKHRLYYSGDTGLFPAMKEIGDTCGPFDLTMIEVGQYNRAWPDWHIGPEQAVIAHRMVKGKNLLPVHWALFELAAHGWTEPIERVLVKAKELNVNVLTPKPGQSFEPDTNKDLSRWWPNLPWKTAAQDPIRSTQLD